MRTVFRIRRYDPERSPEPRWQEFEVDSEPGTVVLYALHDIHENQDGTLAYRYSCRGAICGSCAMRINGKAALACKTQISELEPGQPILLEPLLNMNVVKDLVVDHEPFFASLRTIMPWLSESRLRFQEGRDPHEPFSLDDRMSAQEQDEFLRATDCIMCQSCFSDCPKRLEDAHFVGPATCVAVYKRIYHPQESGALERLKAASEPGGIFDCDRHANCVKVCPKDCRPLRAITMLRRRAERQLGVRHRA